MEMKCTLERHSNSLLCPKEPDTSYNAHTSNGKRCAEVLLIFNLKEPDISYMYCASFRADSFLGLFSTNAFIASMKATPNIVRDKYHATSQSVQTGNVNITFFSAV